MTSFENDSTPERQSGAMLSEPDNPLRHYAGVLSRRIRWVIIGVVVGVLLGAVASVFIKPKPVTTHFYKATNTLTLDSGTTPTASPGSTYTLAQAAQLIQSQELLAAVGKKTGMTGIEAGQHLSAIPRQDEYALDVTGISTSPKTAVLLANTGSDLLNAAAQDAAKKAYTSQLNQLVDQKTSLESELNGLQEQIATHPDNEASLQAQYSSKQAQLNAVVMAIENLGTSAPTLQLDTLAEAHAIEINHKGYQDRLDQNINAPGQTSTQATTSSNDANNETHLDRPTTLSRPVLILLGGGLGLLVGLIVAFTIEAWDDRIRSRTRVETLCDLPVLAEIPNLTREQASTFAVAMVDSAKSPTAERYRATCTAVLFALGETATGRPDAAFANGNGTSHSGRAPVILVTSPGPGEGKTTTSANLAAAFADTGRRVLVVDADFRRPALARYLTPVPNLVDPDGPATTRVDGVSFLAAPRSRDTAGDVVFELRRLIASRQEDFDVIVVDTPPMLTTNDATDLLAAADAVVLVLRSGHTRTASAQRAATVLSRLRADVLGVVLNGCDRKDMDTYYAYGYYYGGNDKKKKAWQRSAPETPRESETTPVEAAAPRRGLTRR